MHQWKNPTLVYRNAFDLNNNVIKMVWSAPEPNPYSRNNCKSYS
jgi:hypothetical protein